MPPNHSQTAALNSPPKLHENNRQIDHLETASKPPPHKLRVPATAGKENPATSSVKQLQVTADFPPSSVEQVLTPEIVQQMIVSAFSALGLKNQVSGTIIAKGPKVGKLFPICFSIPRVLSFACTSRASKTEVWHKRLGHPNSIVLSHLSNYGFLGNKNQFSATPFDCSTCKLSKSKTLPFLNFESRATKCFDVIHSDVCGISPTVSHAHFKYFVTFIDDYS